MSDSLSAESIRLRAHGGDEIEAYDGAGHGFFAVDRPSCRVVAANDGWQRIAAFFAEHLR